MAEDRHVRRDGNDYADALLALFPRGHAWPRNEDSVLSKLAHGLCQIMGYMDGRAADLLEIESDPRATDEILEEWERAFGLPDHCIPNPSSDPAIRRANLVQRMTMLGEASRQFFIDQAEAVGQTVSIREHAPYVCGISRCGDSRMASLTDDTAHFRWQCGPPENRFYWEVKLLALLPSYSGVDLFCMLQQMRQAQTMVLMDYSDFSNGNFDYPWYSGVIAAL